MNAGRDTISVFAVRGDRLALRQVLGSGGVFPVSVAVHGDLVYVLNALNGGSVQGYRVLGRFLARIPGWHRALGLDPNATPQFTTTPGQVAFTPDGSQVVVTTKGNGNDIDVFGVSFSGRLSAKATVNAEPGSVTLRGNVAQPGRYPWHSGMRISDLIPNREFLITREYWKQQNAIVRESETTGGHVKGTAGTVNSVKRNAPEIDWNYAVVQRMSTQDLSTQLIPFDLGKAILGQDAASNVPLQSGDIITIFSQADLKVPEGQQTKLITLVGEFGSAGVYRVMPGENLREAVQKAGGITPSAYLYASQFTRESARVEQQARLDLLVAQAERNVATSTAKRAQSAQTAQEVSAANASFEAERVTLEKLGQLKAEGRVVLNIHPDDHTLDSIPDIPLEDGDQFYVPARPIAVNVVGDVYSPGSYIQQPGKTVNAYLKNAGGPNRDAVREGPLWCVPTAPWSAKTRRENSGGAGSKAWS